MTKTLKCEFAATGDPGVYRCIRDGCDNEFKNVTEDEPRLIANCRHGQPPKKRTGPGVVRSAFNFGKAMLNWAGGEKGTRTKAEIETLMQICKSCPLFDGKRCTHRDCGCAVNGEEKFFNKLAWKSEHCPIYKWGLPLEKMVTACVTAFKRPESLARLLDSIKRFYPSIPIIVEDTEGNLSAARNRLAAKCKTPFLLLLEDDFEFGAETRIETLADVLSYDASLGCAAGAIAESDALRTWAQVYRWDRDGWNAESSRQAAKATPLGTVYQPCELVFNFGLWRREVFFEVPWPEELEMQEHLEYYKRLAEHGHWQCGLVRGVSILHHKSRPSEEYRAYRSRKFNPPRQIKTRRSYRWSDVARPNIVLFGTGHCGTSATAKMLGIAGWNLGPGADGPWCEHPGVRAINAAKEFDGRAAADYLRSLQDPWAIKDPRFAKHLHKWLYLLGEYSPLLVWLQRPLDEVAASFKKRGKSASHLPALWDSCQEQYDLWPWAKMTVSLADLTAAARIIGLPRGEMEVKPANWTPEHGLEAMMGARWNSRSDWPHLLNALGLTGEIAEIGVRRGAFTKTTLAAWRGKRLHLVDPWVRLDDYNDSANEGDREADLIEAITATASQRQRTFFHRATSTTAARFFPPESLDAVYIDANHEQTAADIAAWWPLVRSGGIVAGHDYLPDGFIKTPAGGFACTVKRDVDAWAAAHGTKLYVTQESAWNGETCLQSPSWMMFKP